MIAERLKFKNKMKILKVARGKQLVRSEGSPGRLKPDLSPETIRPESQRDDIVKVY